MSDEEGQWKNTAKCLKYFQMPPPSAFPLNLKSQFEQYQIRSNEYTQASLSKLENYLMENHVNILNTTGRNRIITARYVLKFLMNTPYRMYASKKNDWSIKGTKFKDTIFLTRMQVQQRMKTEERTYHYKFHQYCFSESPNAQPITDQPFDENKLLFGLFRTNVDNFEIIYSSEIIGVESKEEIKDYKNEDVLNKCNFVMTKLLWERSVDRYPEWRRNPQMLGIWLQSYLGCVENIYVGFKTDDGLVSQKIEQEKTQSFPYKHGWNPEICKRFMRNCLIKIQSVMKKINCPYTVFEFKFDSQKGEIVYHVFEGKSDHSFLSEKFINFMQNI